MDLTTATPAEIDTVLAEIWERRSDAVFAIFMANHDIEATQDRLAANWHGMYAEGSYNHQSALESIARLEAKIVAQHEIVAACDIEALPLEVEFDRRGGWTRAYKVLNSNGHVHTSMNCNTCYPTTRFGWLPQVSGLDESEIVDMAGEGACTVCYPSAPCIGPNTLYTPVEAAERAARAAEKDERLAKKIEKSLSLDGSIVEVRWDHETTVWNSWHRTLDLRHEKGWKELKTYRAAELFIVDALSGVGYDHPSQDVIDHVLSLMAAKKGKTVEEIREPLQAKADKKRAKVA